jgi:hypothetical protein
LLVILFEVRKGNGGGGVLKEEKFWKGKILNCLCA